MTMETNYSKITYSQARANFAAVCTKAAEDAEVVIIQRRDAEDVALISASELSGLIETAHLLRSPRNATRLQHALDRATARTIKPQTLDQLRQSTGLDDPIMAGAGKGAKKAARSE